MQFLILDCILSYQLNFCNGIFSSNIHSNLISWDQGKSFEYHIWGSKWPQHWLASSGLEWPRIFKEVIQPRGWNKNFTKSNFMHSPKIWAKSDYGNPFKTHIFCSKLAVLVEAEMTSKVVVPNFFQLILKIQMLIDF